MVTTSISVDGRSIEVRVRGGRGPIWEDGLERNSYLEYSILQRTDDSYGRNLGQRWRNFKMAEEVMTKLETKLE
jgi:hypothetical protein